MEKNARFGQGAIKDQLHSAWVMFQLPLYPITRWNTSNQYMKNCFTNNIISDYKEFLNDEIWIFPNASKILKMFEFRLTSVGRQKFGWSDITSLLWRWNTSLAAKIIEILCRLIIETLLCCVHTVMQICCCTLDQSFCCGLIACDCSWFTNISLLHACFA